MKRSTLIRLAGALATTLTIGLILFSCSKDSLEQSHSYSVCPAQLYIDLDMYNQVEYTLSGHFLSDYSHITVCFRRVSSNGNIKTYSEITDQRDNPNIYTRYRTYKKLNYDETGVVVKWVELTEASSGKVTRYTNYKAF